MIAEEHHFFDHLHAFDHDIQTQALPHRDNGPHEFGPAVVTQTHDKRAVDLEFVERESSEVAQRGIPGAEVVDGQSQPHRFQLLHQCDGGVLIADHNAFREFQFQRVGRQSGVGERLSDRADETGVELQGGYVHGDLGQVKPLLAQADQLTAGLIEHPVTHVVDQAQFFNDGNPLEGRNHALLHMLPAQQGLGADHRSRAAIDLRLKMQHQLFSLHRATQIDLELKAFAVRTLHVFRVNQRPVAAGLLGLGHGRIGGAQKTLDIAGVVGGYGDANA